MSTLQNPIEDLIHELDVHVDPATRQHIKDLIQSVMAFHAKGLARLLEILKTTDQTGQEIINCLGNDPLVSSLLVLHDMHPQNAETRLRECLERVRSLVAANGGSLEIDEASPTGSVRLHVRGMTGCGSTRTKAMTAIQEMVYASCPDVCALHVEGLENKAHTAFVPSSALFKTPQTKP